VETSLFPTTRAGKSVLSVRLSREEDNMTIITCKSNTELPKTPLYCYGRGGVKSVDDALKLHTAKGRAVPPVVYMLKGEYYFPVVLA